MSVYVMIRVAKRCPSTRDELEGCGNPLPRLVQKHAEDILVLVEVNHDTVVKNASFKIFGDC